MYPGTGRCYSEMCVYTPTQVRVHRYFVKGSISGKHNHLSHMDKLILNIFPGVSGTNWLFFLPFTCRVQLLSEVLNNVVGSRVIPVLTTILHSKMMFFQLPYKSHINHRHFLLHLFSSPWARGVPHLFKPPVLHKE